MRNTGWIALALALIAPNAFANGGGYFRGGVERAGDLANFEPEETEKIRILDEKLTVALRQHEADVEVRYLMRNETNKKVKVKFGFPVEESFDNNEMMGEPPPAAAKGKAESLRYCKDYQITAGGKSIAAKWHGETKRDAQFKGIVGWLVSEMTFAAGEEIPVMIHFRSGYPMEEWSVSDDGSTSAALFRYRLSTAACWAGTIGTGRIVLKPDGIDSRELKVLKPVNRFQREGESWVWNFENLEPTLADDLEIEARPATRSYPADDEGRGRYTERGSQWEISHVNYQVKASSTLLPADGHTYEADKVKTIYQRGETWSEGVPGHGAGEWLELKPQVPKPLAAIEIDPGYSFSEERFRANARPKKILINLNQGAHQFTAAIPDARESYRIPIVGYTQPVTSIRLTFSEVWPGARYADLCVSSVRLHVKLTKKPKIQPAR